MTDDYVARSIDEHGFLRTANGARILCNPDSTYYNLPSNPLPRRNWAIQDQMRKNVAPGRRQNLDCSVDDF